jgi:hypothetical protein
MDLSSCPAWLGAGVLALALPSHATLTQTNGNFDAGVASGTNQNDIAGWFDGNHHPTGFWEDAWQSTTNLPTGHSGGVAAFSSEAGASNFLYQAIGTRNSGDTALNFSISLGAFTDVPGIRTGTLTVGLYEQTGSFTGADGVDVAGAEGITQVGTSVVVPITREGGAAAVASIETGSFDISGANADNTLYLRFQWSGEYISLDNVSASFSDGTQPDILIHRVISPAVFADDQTRVTVEFTGVPNRIYQIQHSTDMGAGSWSTPASFPTGPTGKFEATFSKPGNIAAAWNARMFFRLADAVGPGAILNFDALRGYVSSFNSQRPDDTNGGPQSDGSTHAVNNAQASAWMEKNVPLFECSDKELEEIYHFRWWTYRKHVKNTPAGFVVTEFLPKVDWSVAYNTINCPVGHHLYEGRWIRDPKIINDYTRFHFGKGGDPGGVSKRYSQWIADGIHASYLVHADKPFITGLLDPLVNNHEAWKQGGPEVGPWQVSRLLDNGLYWQFDSWEGQEVSIGGTGIRPPVNSYRYGDAMAIARIADLAGRKDLADRYRDEARRLRDDFQTRLWDPEAKFFKVMRHAQAPMNQYHNQAAEDCAPGNLVNVREIFGYVPWYFNMPEDGRGYEQAWRQLTDPAGFQGAFGPTVAERRHPKFFINPAGCMWCGASWPFATSQTLTAMANLINNYPQEVIGKKEYFDLLKTYTRSHRHTLDDGKTVPWIDESLNPDTGRWIMDGSFPMSRGRDYNHSTYCDLIITGLVGLRPRADDLIEVNPLVPEGVLDYFCLDNIAYHGRNLTVSWDKTGNRYGRGAGLRVLADGREIARSATLARVTATLDGGAP